MKKIVLMIAALLMLSTADADAQGFLKKLKQKAQAVVGNASGDEESKDADDADEAESGDVDPSQIAVAQGSDIVPKRKTSTVTWDGVITPSKASTASALMKELPALPSAEKMARSTMEEREALRPEDCCCDPCRNSCRKTRRTVRMLRWRHLRLKWENKVQNLFGLTKEEMAILQDENAPESKKKPIQDKVMANIMGGSPDQAEMQRFEKMSEKEQEAYIKAHPEFTQKMMKMAQNAGNFSKKMKQMTAALNGYEAKLGKLVNNYLKGDESGEKTRLQCYRQEV